MWNRSDLFMLYLTMLSVAEAVYCQMIGETNK
jgi:hypothetical protein